MRGIFYIFNSACLFTRKAITSINITDVSFDDRANRKGEKINLNGPRLRQIIIHPKILIIFMWEPFIEFIRIC